ncbi:MAG: nuclear transport factor 2 family protein [Candidatus Cybelea sp.]
MRLATLLLLLLSWTAADASASSRGVSTATTRKIEASYVAQCTALLKGNYDALLPMMSASFVLTDTSGSKSGRKTVVANLKDARAKGLRFTQCSIGLSSIEPAGQLVAVRVESSVVLSVTIKGRTRRAMSKNLSVDHWQVVGDKVLEVASREITARTTSVPDATPSPAPGSTALLPAQRFVTILRADEIAERAQRKEQN